MRILIAGAAAAFLAAPALANETKTQCEDYVASNGGDASGCACLGEKAAADSALAEALSRITSPADLEAASESTKEAIRACFPDSAA